MGLSSNLVSHNHTQCNLAVVTCDVPPTPDNAVVEGDFVPASNNQLVAFGGTVMYSCMEGFVLIGDDERMCRSDGTFTGTLPTCTGERNHRNNTG